MKCHSSRRGAFVWSVVGGLLSSLSAQFVVPGAALAADIVLSRTSGQVPFALHVSTTAPYKNRFVWSVAGQTDEGMAQGFIINEPGTHTVQLKEYSDATGQLLATTSQTVTVSAFAGQRYYIDASNGNDGNSGLSPQSAWRTAAKVAAFLNQLPANQRNNRWFLFKRGDVHQLTSTWFSLSENANLLRFTAYAAADGSDNPSLPKPLFQYATAVQCSGSSTSSIIGGHLVQDVVFANLEFRGDFNPAAALAGGSCNWQNQYVMNGIGFLKSRDITYDGIEIRNLGLGFLTQAFDGIRPYGLFIHNVKTKNLFSAHLFGEASNVSIKDSRFENSASTHITYFGPDNAALVRNYLSGSGTRYPEVWHACVMRLNDVGARVYIADNYLSDAAGTTICAGRNYPGPVGDQVLVERNIFDGSVSPGHAHIPFWHIADVGFTNSTIRNNHFRDMRGSLNIFGNSAGSIQNMSIVNNTFSSDARLEFRTYIHFARQVDAANQPHSYNLGGHVIRNNIFAGHSGPTISFGTTTYSSSGYDIDNNLVLRVNGQPTYMIEQTLNNYIEYSIAQWRAMGHDLNSLYQVDPQFESVTPGSYNFLRIRTSSPAVDRGSGVVNSRDHLGRLRSGSPDLGAFEAVAAPGLGVSNLNPDAQEQIVFHVSAGAARAGQSVAIVASASGATPPTVVNFSNGTVSVPLVLDRSFINALSSLSGRLDSQGTFTAQVSLAQLFPEGIPSAPIEFMAGTFDALSFRFDSLTNGVTVTASGPEGRSVGGGSGSEAVVKILPTTKVPTKIVGKKTPSKKVTASKKKITKTKKKKNTRR